MSTDVLVCPDVIIAIDTVDSPWILAKEVYGDAEEITLAGTTGDVTVGTQRIEVTNVDDAVPAAGDIHILTDAADVDVVLPAPGDAKVIPGLHLFKAFRIHTTIAAVVITSSSIANPTQILCAASHLLVNGQNVVIAGHITAVPDINAAWVITLVDADEFTVPENVTVGGTGGTVQADGVSAAVTFGMTRRASLVGWGY